MGPIVGQSVLAFLYRCIGAVVTFLFGVILARTMAVDEYGVLMSSMALAFIAGTVALIGQQTQLLREMPKLLAQGNHAVRNIASQRLKLVCLGSITVTFVAAVAFIIGHGRIAIFGRWEYMTWLLLIFPLAMVDMQSAAGRALGSMHLTIAPKDVLWRLLILVMGAAYLLMSRRQLGASDVFLIAIVVLAVLIIAQQACLRRLMGGGPLFSLSAFLSKSSPGLTLRAAVPFWATSVAVVLFPTMDIVLVSALVGPEAGAYYYAANRIALLLDFFMGAFSIPAATCIARCYDAGHRNQITRFASSGALLAFIFVFAALAVLVVAGRLVLTAFGDAFVHSYGVMLLLSSGQLVNAYLGVGTPALDMTGHQSAAMRIMAVTSFTGVIVMVGATLAFGVWGAAVTATMSPLAMKAAMAVHIYRAEGIDITASSKIRELLARFRVALHGRKSQTRGSVGSDQECCVNRQN
jgi:O-antigen/teichoic acid export membrane protein